MKLTTCTAFTDPPERCGQEDECSRVTLEVAGRQVEHWVCAACRKRMGLPDQNVNYVPR